MPELPEVETVVRTLEKQMGHPVIEDVTVLYPRIIDNTDPETFCRKLKGQRIEEYDRRGKFLLFHLTDYLLIAHLRMEGKFYYFHQMQQPLKHTHVCFQLDNGQLQFNDVRKFGRLYLYEKNEEAGCLDKLGYEPFDERLDGDYLKAFNRRNHTPIKSQLLDQSMIAGIGNIYANEICFDCRISPQRPACFISAEKYDEIAASTRKILSEAIKAGGTTIRSYTSSLGVTGLFQQSLYVQSREKQPCLKCPETIRKTRLNGRGTYYCPNCQKERPIVCAITGNIGSGKSSVTQRLAQLGYPTISCDAINHQLLRLTEVRKNVAQIVDCPLEKMDNRMISDIIFSDQQKRAELENYLHELIKQEILKWIEENSGSKVLFVEVPLLFEARWDRWFDFNITVTASVDVIRERLKKDRNMTEQQIQQRLAAQMDSRKKQQMADHVIVNDGTLKALYQQIDKMLKNMQI